MSLTTTDKQDIKVMIQDSIASSPTAEMVKKIGKKLDRLAIATKTDIKRVELLMEDTNVNVKQMLGMLSDNLKVKPQVDDHEVRLTEIETHQPSIISTLALHSKQLKV